MLCEVCVLLVRERRRRPDDILAELDAALAENAQVMERCM